MPRAKKPSLLPAVPEPGPSKMTPEMLVERVQVFDVDQLSLMEGNPNQGDIGALHASFAEFGQIETILVQRGPDGRMHVLNGNHRVMTERQARRFGGKLAGIDVTGLDIDDVRGMAAGLTLNRSARLGNDDIATLAAALMKIGDSSEDLLQAVGYDLDDLDSMLSDINRPLADEKPPTPPRTKPEPVQVEFQCPECGHHFSPQL